ncbi:hypothetical protein C0995_002727 [Termitomyces sp. Mi166|nr:hypothetical protein C0995_002727 [Termitomyces sp. Mi166\
MNFNAPGWHHECIQLLAENLNDHANPLTRDLMKCSHSAYGDLTRPGRVVPVEIGVDYRAQEWTQKLMNWDDFLAYLDLDEKPLSTKMTQNDIIYLAQHNLSLQFPELVKDIVVPDYVYVSMDPPEFCHYRPPGNDEQLVINMWLGPKGTISPAHTTET